MERGPLLQRGLDRLSDAIDRQVGDARGLLVAEVREITLVLCCSLGIIRWRDGIEARLLLVTERLVDALERRTHGLHGREHDLQPALHCRKPSGRDAGQVLRTAGLEHVDGLRACGSQFVEHRALRISRLHDLGNAFDRPVGQLRSVVAANADGIPLRAPPARHLPRGRATPKERALTLAPPKRATPKGRPPTPAPPKRPTPKGRPPIPAPPKRATLKERAPPRPKAPPREAKPNPPPTPPANPPCPPKLPPRPPKPPPCPAPPAPPPRASASIVRRGTIGSSIAVTQRVTVNTGVTSLQHWARRAAMPG